MLKVYGYYTLPWNATVGAFCVAQSGQPWETWSYEPYIALTTNTSDTARYAEPAGSRRTDAHWQLDLNYTQNFRLGGRYNAADRGRPVQRDQQADRLQLPAERATTRRFGTPRTSSTRGGSSSRRDSVLDERRGRCSFAARAPRPGDAAHRRARCRSLKQPLASRSARASSHRRAARARAMRAALSGSFSSTLTCARLKSAIG